MLKGLLRIAEARRPSSERRHEAAATSRSEVLSNRLPLTDGGSEPAVYDSKEDAGGRAVDSPSAESLSDESLAIGDRDRSPSLEEEEEADRAECRLGALGGWRDSLRRLSADKGSVVTRGGARGSVRTGRRSMSAALPLTTSSL